MIRFNYPKRQEFKRASVKSNQTTFLFIRIRSLIDQLPGVSNICVTYDVMYLVIATDEYFMRLVFRYRGPLFIDQWEASILNIDQWERPLWTPAPAPTWLRGDCSNPTPTHSVSPDSVPTEPWNL